MLVAGPLLAAALTRDPVLVAGLAFAQRLPWLLFSLISGALVDRLDRRRLMFLMDLFRSAVVGALGLAVLLDIASLPLLYVVFFLLGTAETLFDTASLSVLPSVVPDGSLERANAQLFGVQIVTNQFAGPPLGGFLFAASATLPFLLDAGSFAAAAVCVLVMRGNFRVERLEGTAPTTLRSEIAEGLRWLFRHRFLRTLALAIGVMNLTLTAAFSIMVLYAQERLGLGPVGYGLLLSSLAVGGIAGSVVAERIVGWLGQGTPLRVGLLIEATTHLVIALATDVFVVGAILALFGFHGIVWGVVSTSLRQQLIPSRLIGRVNSVYLLFSSGSVSLGALLGGMIARGFGLTAPFWFASSGIVLLTLLVWPAFSDPAVAQAKRDAHAPPGSLASASTE